MKSFSLFRASQQGSAHTGRLALVTASMALGLVFPRAVYAQNVYVGNYDGASISVFNPSGNFLFNFATESTLPTGIAFDRNGVLYVAQRTNKSIVRYAQDGTYLGKFATLGSAENLNSIAFDAGGNLFVNASNNTVYKIATSGAVSTFVTGSAYLNNPTALAFAANGNVYVGNYSSSTISVFSASGALVNTISGGGITNPSNFAFDAGGNLFVGDDYVNRISKVTTGGAVTTFTNTPTRPAGLAFSSSGNLLVANLGGNTGGGNSIQMYSPSGADLGMFATGNLNSPAGIAISNSSLLPVASAPEPGSLALMGMGFAAVGSGLGTLRSLQRTRSKNRKTKKNPRTSSQALSDGSGATPARRDR